MRDERAKESSKTQQQFRDYASDNMLEAADRYCSGTTRLLIAKSDWSRTHLPGETFRFVIALVMGYKLPQTASVKFHPDGSAVCCTACKGGNQLRVLCEISCHNSHQAGGRGLSYAQPVSDTGRKRPTTTQPRQQPAARRHGPQHSGRKNQQVTDGYRRVWLTPCPHTARIPRRRRPRGDKSPSTPNTTTLDESSYQRW